MDGINGINGGYTLAELLPLAWLNSRLGFVDQRLIVVALLADLVFCWFNFRPKGKAKCFAGDVGSVGAAFIVVFVLGLLILRTGDFTYIVFLAVYGVDAVLTIVHRIMLHEHLGEAHRKHAYQLMANELGMEHTVVSPIYTGLQLVIAVGMILIPNTPVWHWGYLVGVCMVLAVAYVAFMKKYYHLHEAYLASLKK
jgi:UDP-N-acetylmuramyl pentapeptide phosphotransferase/UDP-N-acetylglucosamine-1-phosphate transferase